MKWVKIFTADFVSPQNEDEGEDRSALMRDMSLTLAPDDLGVLGSLTGTERKRKDIRECVENDCSVRLKRIRVEEEESNGERYREYQLMFP